MGSSLLEISLHGSARVRGPIAKVGHLCVVSGLPKTRSGKVMRRILRKIVHGTTDPLELGDISTLTNPEVIEEAVQKVN